MSKIAFIYPGQGAQAVGMGADFYEKALYQKLYLIRHPKWFHWI